MEEILKEGRIEERKQGIREEAIKREKDNKEGKKEQRK